MKNLYLGITISVVFLIGITFTINKVNEHFPFLFMESEIIEGEPVLGIYDPLDDSNPFKAEGFNHLIFNLNSDDIWEVVNPGEDPKLSEVKILLTIKIWSNSILHKFLRGEYDKGLADLLKNKIPKNGQIYIRFLPDMEMPYTKLPWANYGGIYSDAYEKFYLITKKIIPNAKMIWSPTGYPGLMEHYPKDKYVDFNAINLGSEYEKDSPYLAYNNTKDEIKRKLFRLRFSSKPVLIFNSRTPKNNMINENLITDAIKELKEEKRAINFQFTDLSGKKQDHKGSEEFKIGMYDPSESLISNNKIIVEHIFTNIKNVSNGEFSANLNKVLKNKNEIIITLEPFFNDPEKNTSILTDILAGKYDKEFEEFYGLLDRKEKHYYIRFAHEMEIPVDRYPWQLKDPVTYIKAYRYFVQLNKSSPNNFSFIWGPAGDRGLMEYWPGEDVVDYISIAIYGLPDKNITDPVKQESFEKIYNRKSSRLNYLNKPIFITEFGVKGESEFQDRWLDNAAKVINDNPRIMGVSYFNNKDVPKAWGKIKPPDWSINRKTLESFLLKLNR